MTKKDLSETIETHIDIFENEHTPFENKRDALEEVIDLCKLYKEEFKIDYKHNFIGNNISFSEPVLGELEKLVEYAYENDIQTVEFRQIK